MAEDCNRQHERSLRDLYSCFWTKFFGEKLHWWCWPGIALKSFALMKKHSWIDFFAVSFVVDSDVAMRSFYLFTSMELIRPNYRLLYLHYNEQFENLKESIAINRWFDM